MPNPVRIIEHLTIAMPDGVKLAARLWLPEGAETKPVPAILEYIPYRKRDGTRSLENRGALIGRAGVDEGERVGPPGLRRDRLQGALQPGFAVAHDDDRGHPGLHRSEARRGTALWAGGHTRLTGFAACARKRAPGDDAVVRAACERMPGPAQALRARRRRRRSRSDSPPQMPNRSSLARA